MRRETGLILGFVGFVGATSAVLWGIALPALRPLSVAPIVSATMAVGSTRTQSALDAAQIHILQDWFAGSAHEWGPLSRTPPSTGDAILTLHPASGADYTLSVWLGAGSADWNDAVVIQRGENGRARYATMSTREFAPLRRIVLPSTSPSPSSLPPRP